MYKKNIFSNKKKSVALEFTEENFPSLFYPVEILNTTNLNSSNSYAEKLNHVIEEIDNNDILEPGCVKITIDKNNKIKSVYNPSNQTLGKPIDYLIQFKKDIEPMFERWENFKKNYIDLYGEEDYYHQYKFPNYDYNYLYKEFEEEEEEEFYDLEDINY